MGERKNEMNRPFPFSLLEMDPGAYHSCLIMFERLSLKVSKVILPKVGTISSIIPVFFIMILRLSCRLSYLQNQSKAPLKCCSAANNKTHENKPIYFVTGGEESLLSFTKSYVIKIIFVIQGNICFPHQPSYPTTL